MRKNSKGHVAWFGDYEYYKDAHGNLYCAHKTNVLDVRGYAQGRFECPPHLVNWFLDHLRGLGYNIAPTPIEPHDS
jgi:hypothetical protein